MTLKDAIEEVKSEWRGVDYTAECFTDEVWVEYHCEAIATILNAVVKGELVSVESVGNAVSVWLSQQEDNQ